MKHLKKLIEQQHAADIVCQNFDFLVESTDDLKERDALIVVRNNLRTLLAVYRSRVSLQSREEQLKVISINDYQDAKAR